MRSEGSPASAGGHGHGQHAPWLGAIRFLLGDHTNWRRCPSALRAAVTPA